MRDGDVGRRYDMWRRRIGGRPAVGHERIRPWWVARNGVHRCTNEHGDYGDSNDAGADPKRNLCRARLRGAARVTTAEQTDGGAWAAQVRAGWGSAWGHRETAV